MYKFKLLPIVLLCFVTFSLRANQPLKYNLNVGDEYFYKIDNKYWFNIKVTGKKRDKYQLESTLLHYQIKNPPSGMDKNTSFRLYNASSIRPYFAIFKDLPIEFELSRNGKLRMLAQDTLEIFNKRNFGDRRLEYHDREMGKLKSDLKTYKILVSRIFTEYNNHTSNSWTQNRDFDENVSFDLEYKLEYKNDSLYCFQAESNDFQSDTINRGIFIRITHDNLYGKRMVDSKTGMLIQSTQNYSHTFKFTHRSSDINKLKFTRSITKYDPEKELHVILSGKINPSLEEKEIRFFIYNQYLDHELFRHTVQVDSNGYFYLNAYLDRPCAISWSLDKYVEFERLLLEPGDSLFINVDRNEIQFTGKGAIKNNLNNEIINISNEAGRKMTSQISKVEAKRLDSIYTNKLRWLIYSKRDLLSNWAFQHTLTSSYYRIQNELLSYYYHKNDKKVNETMFNYLFDGKKDFGVQEASSIYLRVYLRSYVFRKLLILKGHEYNTSMTASEYYALSKTLFKGEMRYAALSHILFEEWKRADLTDFYTLFADFIKQYPNQEFTKILDKFNQSRSNLADGQLAPDFTLPTLDGEMIKLSDYKGKWVMLLFSDIQYDRVQKMVKECQVMKKELSSDNFEMLIAFVNEDDSHTKDFLNNNKIEGVLLDNHGWKNQEASKYNSLSRAPYFIINPEGEIFHSAAVSPIQQFTKIWMDYIKADIFSASKSFYLKKTVVILLISISLLLILIRIYYKIKTRRIQKREAAKNERLELELNAVRSQLNPHFLYNSMSSIQHLVNAGDNEAANNFLAKFGSLMRTILTQSDKQLVPLHDELETIKTYLELESLRHNFVFNIEIDEAIDTYTIEIPPMLIQPFVENAVVHGINSMKDGKIDIQVCKPQPDRIKLILSDNGKGLEHSEKGNGYGLKLTQKRIDLIMDKYANEISFKLRDKKKLNPDESGAEVEIIIEIES